jgi:hypothetical protein
MSETEDHRAIPRTMVILMRVRKCLACLKPIPRDFNLSLASGLDDRSLALANRRFSLSDAAGKADSDDSGEENDGKLLHGAPLLRFFHPSTGNNFVANGASAKMQQCAKIAHEGVVL